MGLLGPLCVAESPGGHLPSPSGHPQPLLCVHWDQARHSGVAPPVVLAGGRLGALGMSVCLEHVPVS